MLVSPPGPALRTRVPRVHQTGRPLARASPHCPGVHRAAHLPFWTQTSRHLSFRRHLMCGVEQTCPKLNSHSKVTPLTKERGVERLHSTSYHWSIIFIFCLKFSSQFKTDLIYFLPTSLIFPELSKLYFTPLLTGVPARWRTFASSSI